MSESSLPVSRPAGVHVALAMLGLAISIFLAAQISGNHQQGKMLAWQIDNGNRQIDTAKKNEAQLADAITQQDKVVELANQVQKQYQSLLDDLLKLSDDDTDAKAIVEKWKIQRSQPPASTAPGATPAATPGAGTAAPAATPAK